MSTRVTIRIDGSACYMDNEPDENGVHHGEWKHSEVPVSAVWNDEDCEWEEWHPPDPEPRRRRERGEPMSDIKYEPTRDHWTPYEPWMRDVLADDARTSWASSGTESRSTWDTYRPRTDSWAAGVDLRVHPADVPERPTEPAPDEALATVIYAAYTGYDAPEVSSGWLDVARAAREHIEAEADDADFSAASLYYARAEKAEGERDWWRDWWRDELAERWGKSDVDEQTTRFEEAETAMRVEVKDHDATRARAEKAEAELADERVGHNATLIERERLLNALADMTRQRDKCATLAEKWQARHEALRADVDEFQYRHREYPGTWELVDALGHDIERRKA